MQVGAVRGVARRGRRRPAGSRRAGRSTRPGGPGGAAADGQRRLAVGGRRRRDRQRRDAGHGPAQHDHRDVVDRPRRARVRAARPATGSAGSGSGSTAPRNVAVACRRAARGSRPGPAPWTQCAAVSTRSGAISAPPQNGPRVVSETSHGVSAGGTGVPWNTAATASVARASARSVPHHRVRCATIRCREIANSTWTDRRRAPAARRRRRAAARVGRARALAGRPEPRQRARPRRPRELPRQRRRRSRPQRLRSARDRARLRLGHDDAGWPTAASCASGSCTRSTRRSRSCRA